MSAYTFQIAAIVIYFMAMLAIGFYAYKKTDSHEDYMLGGRNLPPWVAALSAGASDMSGWIMMGLPGAIYATGLIEAWIAIGLTIGAYLNWKFVAPRLRAYTERARNSITIPSFFENRLRDRTRVLRIVSSLVILVFFTFYVASMMVAGGKFFESSFGSSYLLGMLLVAGVTLAYTLFGGFLGASLTDVVQGVMIMIALILMPIVAIFTVGGVGAAVNEIDAVDPSRLSFIGGSEFTGATALLIVSALGWGLGYFGQPHIIVRFMAMRDAASAKSARRIGIGWMVVSLAGSVIGGLVGIAYFSTRGGLADPETVLLAMSQALFHPFIAGLVLAAVLAAIMSTVSSQLIVCSSALVEDILMTVLKKKPSPTTLVMLGRACVLLVALIGILLALDSDSTVLGLVAFAWAGFGAAFGPAVLLSLYWRKLTTWGALAGMVAGAVVVFAWQGELYEIIPGFLANVVVAVVVSLLTFKHNDEVEEEFNDTIAATRTPVAPRA